MENLFLYITHLSLKACVVIPLIIAVRFLIKKQPKVFSYALWSVVFFSLIVNFQLPPPKNITINTPVNKLQNELLTRYDNTLNTYTEDVIVHFTDSVEYYQAIGKGITPVYDEETGTQYVVTSSESRKSPATLSDHLPKVYMLWFAGILVAMFIVIKNSLDISSRLKYSTIYRDNIYIAENLPSPFVFGIVKPKIYIPEILRLKDSSYIIIHEQTHIKRKDHIIKPICLFITIIHWFNPLVWLAFREMNRDMEMSCDEKVISLMGSDNKKAYSMLLLDFATDKSLSTAVLFGESHAENRIKNVLKYKKPAKIAVLVLTAIVACSLVFPLLSDEFNTTPPAAAPVTFYEILDNKNDIHHLQYKYRMGVEGSKLFPHAEYTVNIDDDSSIYNMIHPGVSYDNYSRLINQNSSLPSGTRIYDDYSLLINEKANLWYRSMLGNRIDDVEKPVFSACFVDKPDNSFKIMDFEPRFGAWIIQAPHEGLPVEKGYTSGRIVGHDKLGDNLYISSVITYTEDNTATLYVIRTENGESEIMYEGEAFTITRGIRFLNENVGFASSAESNEFPTAKITRDGGRTWQNLDFSSLAPDDENFYVRNGCIVNIYGETIEIRYHARYTGRQTHADDTYSVISFDGGLTWAGYYRGISWDSNRQGMKYEKATDTIPVMLAQ